MEQSKTYLAQIELGTVTDTYDAAGKIIQKSEYLTITPGQVEEALLSFQGTIEQRPPMYSALRYHGQRLYQLARAGLEVERRPRKVEVHSIKLIHFELPLLSTEIVCGKGTYARTLAHDLGQALGCGAYLKHLSRLKYGPFTIDEALSLPLVEEAFRQGQWQKLLHPIDIPLKHWPSFIASAEAVAALKNGRSFPLTPLCQAEHSDTSQTFARAYTEQGHFLAVLSFERERQEWQPRKVFSIPG
jgi:tRNA pseudouridine55 synthase